MAGCLSQVVFLLLLSLFSEGVLAVDTDGDGIPDSYDSTPNDITEPGYTAFYSANGIGQPAGDVNNDGYDDFVVGDPNYGSNLGRIQIISGKDQSAIYIFYGSDPTTAFGQVAKGAGDVNNDGFADIIIGDRLDNNRAGLVRIISGKDGATLWEVYGDASPDWLGESVDSAGDVNNDGYTDVIAGAMLAFKDGKNWCGYARVFSGHDGSTLYTFVGNQEDFLSKVSGVGDINKDGYSDVAVGTAGNFSGSGYVKIFSGQDGNALYTFYGDDVGDAFGARVSGLGDVNGDSYPDVAVASADAMVIDELIYGYVKIFSGIDGAVLYSFMSSGQSPDDGVFFPMHPEAAGDINRDGYNDILLSDQRSDENGNNAGSTRVISGKDGSILYFFAGSLPESGMGAAVNGAGDINNDGFPDLIITSMVWPASIYSMQIFSGKNNFDYWDNDSDGILNGIDTDDDNDSVTDLSDPFPLDANRWQRVRHNIDFDNDSDVLVRATSTGSWTSYAIQAGAITTNAALNIPTSSDTQYIAQLDANGDGDADVLTRSASTGAWTLYQVQSGAIISSASISLYASLDWKFVGAGDFNGDGTDDVLLRSTSTGLYNSFLINNYAVTMVNTFNAWSSSASVDQGIGDFDGDGTDDLLIRRTTENAYFVFRSVNGLVENYYCACNLWYNPDWTFQFAGDTNKDGIDDIVIRATGASGDGLWWNFRMSNFMSSQITNLNLFNNKTRVGFTVAGDYNGDGTIDVLMRVDGATTYVSPINNGLVTSNNWLQGFTIDQVIAK